LARLLKRRRSKHSGDRPSGPESVDMSARNSYFGFLVGLLDRPAAKRPAA